MNQTNPLDTYSKFQVIDVKLGIKEIIFSPRDGKVGRVWMPVWNDNFPPIDGFTHLPYVYIVDFYKQGNAAGNHYHTIKEEILIPLGGSFEIECIDITTHESIKISLDTYQRKGIYIPTKISHKITSLGPSGILLVLASNPSQEDDEIRYEL